jgi:ketosteroid isomerase-like protein
LRVLFYNRLMNDLNKKALIIELEEKLASAHLTLDLEAISELLHDDYLIVQPGGVLETKQMVLNSYRSAEREWQEANVADLQVNIHDSMARVTGVWKAKGKNKEEEFSYQARFISIWIDEGNGWKNISYCSSEMAEH